MVFLDALLGFIIFIIIINHNHDHDDDDLTPYLSSCHSLGVVGQVLAQPAPLAGLAINIWKHHHDYEDSDADGDADDADGADEDDEDDAVL